MAMMRQGGRFPQNKSNEQSTVSEAENCKEDCSGFCFTCDTGDKSSDTTTSTRVPVTDSEGFCGPDG